ncbi:MAG: hypothetical protein FVQ81_15575 [Candidatus Glassbacteria bacterium]|nr:hypothetical protein [Candidatus Glassbacteria bacterium]
MRTTVSFLLSLLSASILSAPLAALEVIPPREDLSQSRPRLLMSADSTGPAISLAQLRSHTDHPEYEAMLAKIGGISNAACQAMVWQLTGDSAAADSAVGMLARYRYDSGRSYDVFEVFFDLLEYALAYDWMHTYEGFSNLDRGMARYQLGQLARNEGMKWQNDHIFHNYIWMTASGTMLWALATAGEDSTSDALYDDIRQRMNSALYPAMLYLDGLPSESYGYWSLYDFSGAVWPVLAAAGASGQDLVARIETEQDDWLRRHFLNEIHNVYPDMRYVPWGDVIGGPNGSVTHEMAGVLDALTWALDSPEGAWFSQWLAGKRGTGRFYGITGVFYMLYTRMIDTEPAEGALSYLSGGGAQGGHFTARSSWDADATVVSFGVKDHYGDHNHYCQGQFTIFRNGLLATDPLVYGSVNGPQQPSDVHSTLVINGSTQEERHGQNHGTLGSFLSNLDKGQRLDTGDFLFYDEGGDWAAASGQYAQAYAPGVVESCVRQLLFIRPGTVIVMDWLRAPAGGSLGTVDWLLQLAEEPVVGQSMAWATNDSSFISCSSFQPDTVITVQKTSVDTWRVKFSYQADSTLMLTHMLTVGEGVVPTIVWEEVQMVKVDEGYDIKFGDYTYTFTDSGDYAVTARRNVPGDVNKDEKIDIFDVLELLGVISDKNYFPARLDPADVNVDGRVDIFDLLELLRLLKA